MKTIEAQSKLKLITSLCIFGTISLSCAISRSALNDRAVERRSRSIFLLLYLALRRQKLDLPAVPEQSLDPASRRCDGAQLGGAAQRRTGTDGRDGDALLLHAASVPDASGGSSGEKLSLKKILLCSSRWRYGADLRRPPACTAKPGASRHRIGSRRCNLYACHSATKSCGTSIRRSPAGLRGGCHGPCYQRSQAKKITVETFQRGITICLSCSACSHTGFCRAIILAA